MLFVRRTRASKSLAASKTPTLVRLAGVEVTLDMLFFWSSVGEHGESSLFLPFFEGEEGGLGRLGGSGSTMRPVAPQLKREGSRRLPGEEGATHAFVPEGEPVSTGVRERFEGLGLTVGRGTCVFGGVRKYVSCAVTAGVGGRGQLGGGPGNGGVCVERDPARARDQGKQDVVEVGDFMLEVDDASALDEIEGT